MIEVSLDPSDPCRASIRWHSFVAEPHYRLEYRVQLRGEVSQFGLWDLVAWKEAAADLQQDFTQILGNLMQLGKSKSDSHTATPGFCEV